MSKRREDTSTAHQRAVLTKSLSDGKQHPIKYLYTTSTVESAKLSSDRGYNGYLKMANGKFYLSTFVTSFFREVYADGYSPFHHNLVWWFKEDAL